MKNKNCKKIISVIVLLAVFCLSILFFEKFLKNISIGADNSRMALDINLEKYINFNISEEDKGTLVQYDIKVENKQDELREYSSIKNSELNIELGKIHEKYPSAVKVIGKSTELTNGKIDNIQEDYQYDMNTGTILIKASNQNEIGEAINDSKPNENAKDEYVVICYYDTYVTKKVERNLYVKVLAKSVLFDADRIATVENELASDVKDDIGEITNIIYNPIEIYNGYIKSNIINGTDYNTPYTEKQSVMISKKEAQDSIEISENNRFLRVEKDKSNNENEIELENKGELIYKSTKIRKNDITKILGDEGKIEILDDNRNIIASIDKNTKFEEDGSVTISYENSPKTIIIRTSKIQNEGILNIENTKEIKSNMSEMNNSKIKTIGKILGIRKIINENQEESKEEEVFSKEYENRINIKDSKTNLTMEVDNTKWTNKQQNEVTFNIYAKSNAIEDNMLKSPIIKIELPSEVEKVVLGNSSVVYANGLELENPYLETNKKGNIVIVAKLIGSQTEYGDNNLGLMTDVKIKATIILKKDINANVENINLLYTNQYTVDGSVETGEQSKQVEIEDYKDETVEENSAISYNVASKISNDSENSQGLELEVIPVKGDKTIKEGDIVYEGEFIKYNIKITNTSDRKIDDIKLIGTIPEGTVYGELEADYDRAFGEYKYNYYDEIKEKTIEIGTIEPGKSEQKSYEVKVSDLSEGEESKDAKTNIKGYIGNTEAVNYEINNKIKHAEVQVFLASRKTKIEGMWIYGLTVKGNIDGVAELKIQFPKEFEFGGITNSDDDKEKFEPYETSVSDENVMTTKINLTKSEEKEYIINGNIDALKTEKQTEDSKLYLKATATVLANNIEYKSNENNIEYRYENIKVSMTSSNEGEELKYEDEIEYKIEVKSIGKKDYYSEDENITAVNLKDYLPDDVEPISVTYQSWEIKSINENEETGEFIIDGTYEKVEKTEELNGNLSDDEGNKLPDIDINIYIPFYETSIVSIKCKAGAVEEKTKIENSATISGDYIFSKTTNIVSHTILPYDYNESQDTNKPDDTDNTDDKYSISGVAWLDENGDGIRQTNEKLLDGITVMLLNTDNSNEIKATQTTDSKGSYRFSDLEKGKYIVIFNYDTNQYTTTEYQKEGTSSSFNSDATTREITLLEKQAKVGITDIINLEATIQNIDIGLIKNKVCDLRLDKYISKVTVKTNSGTKEQSYDNTQLAKVEIKSKEIKDALVVVEYKVVVKNEGELPISSVKVIDYLPDGFQFSSELNKNWTITKNNEVTSIANENIKSGQSVELKLVLTKSMTSNSTGTFTNIAEIGEMTNSLGAQDIDSTPGNKEQKEDDYSEADLIVSISTGIYMYMYIVIAGLLIAGIFILLNIKFGIKKVMKISMFAIITVLTLFVNAEDSFAETYKNWDDLPKSTKWYDIGNNANGYANFKSSEGIKGYCAMQTFKSANGEGKSRYLDGKYQTKSIKTETTSSVELSLKKMNNNTDIDCVKEGNKLKIGPFKIKGNATSYTYSVVSNKNTNKSPEISNKTTNNGVTTFYLKIPYKDGIIIKRVEVTGKRTVTTTTKNYKNAYAYYIPYSNAGTGTKKYKCRLGHTHNWPITSYFHNYPYQDVMTDDKYMWIEKNSTDKNQSQKLTWIVKNQYEDPLGDLKVKKVDEADNSIKLPNVEFKVQNDKTKKWVKQQPKGLISYVSSESDATIFKTNSKGTFTIENLDIGKYKIKEIKNPNYGYKQDEKREFYADVNSNDITEIVCKNSLAYIDISGTVWLDKEFDTGKDSYRNDLYKNTEVDPNDKNDKELGNIFVRLRNARNDEIIYTVSTNAKGKYTFKKVPIEYVRNSYIEFKYDGIQYTNVDFNDVTNGSKATEIEGKRRMLEDDFVTIEGETVNENNGIITGTSAIKDRNGVKNYTIEYQDENHSVLSRKIKKETEGQSLSEMTASTLGYDIWKNYKKGTTEIEDINLGLYEREQPDLAVIKDIHSAKVTVNGYEYTYKYNQKFANKEPNDDEFNVSVKFGEKYGKQSFSRAIYPSDVNNTDDNNFSVKVLYKITLKNESGELYSKINSLADYYDARYKLETIGTNLDDKGNIINKMEYKTDNSYSGNNKYKKVLINCNTEIAPHEENKNIYIEFELTRSEVGDILFDKNGNQKDNDSISNLENIVEINSYSTYSEENFVLPYAGIDIDSNPNNIIPGNTDAYEDDTDYAPGLKLEVANPRQITGTVFLDNTESGTPGGAGNERKGNGKFDNGENTISRVRVGLYKDEDFYINNRNY